MSEFETGPTPDQPTGISIVPDEAQEAAQPAQDPGQGVDPNEVLNEILQGLSGFQAVMGMFEARIAQLERLTGYLLKKDPEFMANLDRAEADAKAQADAQVAANAPAEGTDGKAEA